MKCSDDNKTIMVMTIATILVLSGLFYGINKTGTNISDISNKQRAACKQLDLHFGEQVTVKEGFYKDVIFVAVSPGLIFNENGEFESYNLKYYMSDSQEVPHFHCIDLERLRK